MQTHLITHAFGASSGNSRFAANPLEVNAWATIAAQHPDAKANRNYRAIRLSQDFPLETVGVMAKLTSALAQAGVSIMAYSTFKTDVVLVREWELNKALGALWDLRF
jgi:hypothetical protein